MKKTSKLKLLRPRLKLSRETVRVLVGGDLKLVRGGGSIPPTIDSGGCDPTYNRCEVE